MAASPPTHVNGNRVIQFASLPSKKLPLGYLAPANGKPALQPIDLVVIAVSEKSACEAIYWLHCLNDRLETVTGDMYYSHASAQRFLIKEYGVDAVVWCTV